MSASFYKVLSPTDWARLQAYLVEESYGFDYQATLAYLKCVRENCPWYDQDSMRKYTAQIRVLRAKYKILWLWSLMYCVNCETGEVYEPVKWIILQGNIESAFTNQKPSTEVKKERKSLCQISLF